MNNFVQKAESYVNVGPFLKFAGAVIALGALYFGAHGIHKFVGFAGIALIAAGALLNKIRK